MKPKTSQLALELFADAPVVAAGKHHHVERRPRVGEYLTRHHRHGYLRPPERKAWEEWGRTIDMLIWDDGDGLVFIGRKDSEGVKGV